MKRASPLPLLVVVAMAVAALGLLPLQPTDLGTVEHTAVVVAYSGLPDFPVPSPASAP